MYQVYLADAGMEKVARVTGLKTNPVEKIEKHGYRVITVKTLEEADKLLDID